MKMSEIVKFVKKNVYDCVRLRIIKKIDMLETFNS